MQIVLSEKEFETLKNNSQKQKQEMHDTLSGLCIRVANSEIPQGESKPYECYITSQATGFCDKCPVVNVCPQTKSWSTNYITIQKSKNRWWKEAYNWWKVERKSI